MRCEIRGITITLSTLYLLGGTLTGLAADTTAAPNSVTSGQTNVTDVRQVELGAQFSLLRDLASNHRQLAEEARKTNQAEKARWEEELTRDLSSKADQAAAQLEELARGRLKAQDAAKKPEGTDPDEHAFLSRVDTQLWRVEQEINAAMENTKGFSAQLQTNNTPDDVVRISFQVQENNTLLRFLERDKTDLELRKLQYRALKKR